MSFANEMHLGLLGWVRRHQVEVGYELVQRVQMVYKWSYLLLDADSIVSKLYWMWLANMAATPIAAGLIELKSQGVATEAWDGAGVHRVLVTQAVELIKVKQPPLN